SPVCEICPAPEYSYVAKAKKLQGVVITQLAVAADGTGHNVKIVHTPNPALANAAIRTVHTWRFKPAQNFHGAPVPVLVDVAIAFGKSRLFNLSTYGMLSNFRLCSFRCS